MLDWIPDGLAELAHDPLEALAPVRRRLLSGSKLSARKALREFALERLPEWAWLQEES